MTQGFVPGDFVRVPDRPDWGLGQVQSVIGNRVTVNFDDAGKQTLFANAVTIVPAGLDKPGDDSTTDRED